MSQALKSRVLPAGAHPEVFAFGGGILKIIS